MPRLLFLFSFFVFVAGNSFAEGVNADTEDAALLSALAFGENDAKIDALQKIAAEGKTAFFPILEALRDDSLYAVDGAAKRVFVSRADGGAEEVFTREKRAGMPEGAEAVMINNRVRAALTRALAALDLILGKRDARLAALDALSVAPRPEMLPLLERALEVETDSGIRKRIETTRAMILIGHADRKIRLRALEALNESSDAAVRRLLEPIAADEGTDAATRAAASNTIRAIDSRLRRGEILGRIFSGLSLGSILLLAALGLAVIYGLMGVINMAHGELIMIGAYAAYVAQNVFRRFLPESFDWYPLLALPAAFFASALTGIFLERTVIRRLYGRPLETLLATWGISLVLIQTVRSIFGAQNVSVENPAWLSGGIEVYSNLILPYNRLAILALAAASLLGVSMLLARTRMGLHVRAVTQNRPMARCLGVPSARVDSLAFGLGAGLAGLAGSALSQVGNVGPELGQAYIVDSFMVVVLGGVGQIAGSACAALGLGVLSKFIEGFSGAVLARIVILLMIIVFIQKRPQGIFAFEGRLSDA